MFSTAPPAAAAPSTGGFGFGAAKPAATGFGAPSTGFGAANTSFGATSTGFGAASTSTSTFSFGSATTAPATGAPSPAKPSGYSFGAAAAPSAAPAGFGLSAAPSLSSTGFGGFGSSTVPSSGFGAPAQSSFGSAPSFGAPQQQAPASQGTPIAQALQKIQSAYAPHQDPSGRFISLKDASANLAQCRKNEECRFKAIFMQKRDESSAQMGLAQPATLLTNPLYEEAEKLNVDPEKYVALEECGVEALGKRFEDQVRELDQAAQHVDKVSALLKTSAEANNTLRRRFDLLAMRQLSLMQQALRVMRKLEVLRCHGAPLQVTELRFRDEVRSLLGRLENPFKQLQDLSVSMALQDSAEDAFEESVADEDIEVLVHALRKHSEGLEQLAETLRKDVRDMSIIRQRVVV